MKRFLFLLCILFLSSQNNWAQTRKNIHTLGLQFSGFISDIPGPDAQSCHRISYGFPIRKECFIDPAPAYSVGVTHGYWVQNWLKWESSLSFSTMAYEFSSEIIRRDIKAIERENTEIWSLIKSMEGSGTIFFIETQTGPHFTGNWKNFRPFIYPYLEMNSYLNNRRREITVYEDGYTIDNPLAKDNITTYNDTYFALGLGIGFEVKIRQRFDLSTMFFMESFDTPFYDFYSRDERPPKNRGISLKINYWLNKHRKLKL